MNKIKYLLSFFCVAAVAAYAQVSLPIPPAGCAWDATDNIMKCAGPTIPDGIEFQNTTTDVDQYNVNNGYVCALAYEGGSKIVTFYLSTTSDCLRSNFVRSYADKDHFGDELRIFAYESENWKTDVLYVMLYASMLQEAMVKRLPVSVIYGVDKGSPYHNIYGKDKKLIGTQYTAFLKAVTIEK